MRKLLMTILALAAIVLPLKAADFDIYGKMYPSVWLTKTERFYDDTVSLDPDSNAIFGSDSVPLYYVTLWPYGTLGFKFKSDKIGACFEIGIRQAAYEGFVTSEANTPLLQVREHMIVYAKNFYAEWYINDWMTLLIGKSAAPACFGSSNQRFYGGNSFSNTGNLWTGSNAMFQLAFGSNLSADDLETGFLWEAKVAAIKVDSVAIWFRNKENTFSQAKFPKFEGSLGLHLEKDFFSASLEFAGGYQQFILSTQDQYVPKDSSEEPVDCYVLAIESKVKFGPVTLAYDWAWGQNLGAYGAAIGNPFVWRGTGKSDVVNIFYPYHDRIIDPVNGDYWKIANGKGVEMCGILNVKPLDWLSFEGGYGYIHAKHDFWKYDFFWHDTHVYYGLVQFKVADLLNITPEVGQYFYGNEPGYGRFTYWGIELAIGF